MRCARRPESCPNCPHSMHLTHTPRAAFRVCHHRASSLQARIIFRAFIPCSGRSHTPCIVNFRNDRETAGCTAVGTRLSSSRLPSSTPGRTSNTLCQVKNYRLGKAKRRPRSQCPLSSRTSYMARCPSLTHKLPYAVHISRARRLKWAAFSQKLGVQVPSNVLGRDGVPNCDARKRRPYVEINRWVRTDLPAVARI
ncbi:hypothetical protein FA95DRAFT_1218520 [Auriscalpium vulgare]|uniref:Uncharacterized protein n=1 Tax=Auriscalpium vulgare TaxID=40419 RepID=A0ACB8RUQ0_9AGAM|nr:hypothetical protein FA95DRAFT_1218520 [Auriscalpium vulgare]